MHACVVGVAFTVLELRNLVKARQTDLVIRLYSTFESKEFQEALDKVLAREYKDYNDYKKKYGWSDFMQVGIFFEGIGVLLHRKLIDVGLVDDLFSTPLKHAWEKMKPAIEDARKLLNRPQWYEYLQYLSHEIQKREQRLQQRQQ